MWRVSTGRGLGLIWELASLPHPLPLPPGDARQVPDYEDRLSKFERMCVVKAFREDRTLVAAADYIADALGQRFVESVPLSMEVRGRVVGGRGSPRHRGKRVGRRPARRGQCTRWCPPTHSSRRLPRPSRTLTPLQRAWAESRPRVPLICLLSPGSDPTKLIEDLAKRKKIKTLGVSMGQGQEVGQGGVGLGATAWAPGCGRDGVGLCRRPACGCQPRTLIVQTACAAVHGRQPQAGRHDPMLTLRPRCTLR